MKSLPKGMLCGVAAGLLAAVLSTDARAVTLGFSNVAGGSVEFDPADAGLAVGSFKFLNDGSGNSFRITGSDGPGDAVNLLGTVSGTFSVGPITAGVFEFASVFGTGTLSIHDGAKVFTANVNWRNITSAGVAGIFNLFGQVNLSNFVYEGSKNDLSLFAAAPDGIGTLTYQFTAPTSLTALFGGPGTVTTQSYSGSLTSSTIPVVDPVPIPAALPLLVSAVAGLAFIGWRRSQAPGLPA